MIKKKKLASHFFLFSWKLLTVIVIKKKSIWNEKTKSIYNRKLYFDFHFNVTRDFRAKIQLGKCFVKASSQSFLVHLHKLGTTSWSPFFLSFWLILSLFSTSFCPFHSPNFFFFNLLTAFYLDVGHSLTNLNLWFINFKLVLANIKFIDALKCLLSTL